MKALSFSYCFPSSVQPTWGVFVLQRLAALARLGEDLEAVSPVPTFPLWSRWRGRLPASVEQHAGLTVHYPRFFYVPWVLKSWDGRWYASGLARWLGEHLARRRPDLLDAHFIWPDGVGVSRLARRFGVPYVITLRGKIYPCVEDRSMRRQCVEALGRAAAVISVSGPMADLAAELGVPRERLHVIPNGVDLERFQPVDRIEARQRLGLPVEGRLLVAIAHLKRTKGHDELVEALARLPRDVRLVIVGGEVERGGYRKRLAALIQRLGLAARVTLAGWQPYDTIPLYLSAADVGVLASYREGCPNVVLESMACGTPVVATRVGAAPDLVTPNESGLIVPPRDAAALAEGLAAALARPWSREAVRRSPGVRSWEAVARQVLAVWRGALGEKAAMAGREKGSRTPDGSKGPGPFFAPPAGPAAPKQDARETESR